MNRPRLPREVVDVPSMGILKVRWDRDLSNMICMKVMDLVAFKGPFQPQLLCDPPRGILSIIQIETNHLGRGILFCYKIKISQIKQFIMIKIAPCWGLGGVCVCGF